MAKFCQNCGSPLPEGANFCTSCGASVAQSAPQVRLAQPTQSVQQQPQSQQFAYQQTRVEPKKKKKRKGVAVFFVLMLIAAIGFFGLRDGGFLRGFIEKRSENRSDSETYDAQSLRSLLDYAEQLEKAGNSEAAAAVYELIARGGGAELIKKAHEELPALKSADEIEQIEEIFDHLKGGDGK
ncbi:MAG: zinc-ribbon domain-containing protein [Oscillospiraceae bacterium]|nr:zinc-ribbon domain-containing protein [Oscillospiraceae bacterium]